MPPNQTKIQREQIGIITTDSITEVTKKFFSGELTLAVLLDNFTPSVPLAVTSTDNIIEALQKLQAQIDNLQIGSAADALSVANAISNALSNELSVMAAADAGLDSEISTLAVN